MVRQSYRYALDPTPSQERALLRHAGARRWAYNHAVTALLEVRRLRAAEHAAGVEGAKPDTKYPSFFDLNTAFNGWKRGAAAPSWWMAAHPETAPEWVGENASQVYLWAIYEARDALNRYFDSYKAPGARRVGFPHRKSRRRDRPRFKVTGGAARPVDSRHIRLPMIGAVRTHESTRKLLRRFTDGRAVIKNATVSRVGTRCSSRSPAKSSARCGPARQPANAAGEWSG